MPTYVVCGLRTQTVGFLWPLFSKNRFLLIKSCIFHFNTFQVNLTSDWALSQPWALEFMYHWGMGALVIRGTKCSATNMISHAHALHSLLL